MFKVGQIVRIVGVFAGSFPDTYEVTEVKTYEDEQIACILGDLGAFDPKYLEHV